VASPPERGRLLAATAAAGICLLAAGCGRANLLRSSGRKRAAHGALVGSARGRGPVIEAERVPVPVPLSAALADTFASAVSLRRVDLPGATPSPRSKTPPAEEREAARCGSHGAAALGGARSPDYQRGAGLDRESISSAVSVLGDAAAVRGDLEYGASASGLACYAKVLSRSIRREQSSTVRLLSLHVSPLRLSVAPRELAGGIRISARVGLTGEPIAVQLFVDALSLPYGPAELDLYSTSFVQPVPERTEHELLRLMLERARLQRL